MSERPVDDHFAIPHTMTPSQIHNWIRRLIREKDALQAEVERLRAIEAAARSAGPWPLLRHETFIDGAGYLECFHCGRDNANSGGNGEVEHPSDCAGVRLRDALEATS